MELTLRGLKSFRGIFGGCRNNKMLMVPHTPSPNTHTYTRTRAGTRAGNLRFVTNECGIILPVAEGTVYVHQGPSQVYINIAFTHC